MIKLLSIGIATMDIYRHHGMMYPGGNEYNIAYHAATLGGKAAFMGVFANDEVGRILYDTLNQKGIDLSYSHHRTGSSGYAIVDLVEGDRVFVDWNKRGVTDEFPIEITEDEILYARQFDIVCTSHHGRISLDKVKKLAEGGVHVCRDFCDFFTMEDVNMVAKYLDFAFFSASHLSGMDEIKKLLKEVVSLGCKLAIATMGGDGSIAYDGKDFYCQPCIKANVIDTMGAGDSFISAFLMNYLSRKADESLDIGDKIRNSLHEAAMYSAKVVETNGSLGIGYQVDVSNLKQIINIKERKEL
ncbi:MAG: PfkB family carbohydrate kinase [Herbinix sp.]|nr:PfkB family carbohydrate kinase [Herbinix sp.]